MNTTRLKKGISYLPEASILSLSGIWFFSNLPAVNYPILGIMLLILVSLIWKVKTTAIISAFLIGLGSIYMMLATWSEYRNVIDAGESDPKLLIWGLSLFTFTLIMGIFLPFKYFKE